MLTVRDSKKFSGKYPRIFHWCVVTFSSFIVSWMCRILWSLVSCGCCFLCVNFDSLKVLFSSCKPLFSSFSSFIVSETLLISSDIFCVLCCNSRVTNLGPFFGSCLLLSSPNRQPLFSVIDFRISTFSCQCKWSIFVFKKTEEALCLAFATYMTRDINDTSVTNPRMTGKPSFAGSWRTTILISHIQHKTICFFQK